MTDKNKLLTGLARFNHPKIQKALDKKIDQITQVLFDSTVYQTIYDNLETFESIALNNPKKSIDIVKKLLPYLNNILLEIPKHNKISSKDMGRFYNKKNLLSKLIDIVSLLKYRESDKSIDILLEVAASDDDELKNKALEALKNYSSYNIRVYYSNDRASGLSTHPQEIILQKIQGINFSQIDKYFSIVINVCENLLSSTMHDTDWDYNSVILKTTSIPVTDNIKIIRQKTINYLINLYRNVTSEHQKISIINTLDIATRTPRVNDNKEYNNVLSMILDDTKNILDFYKSITTTESNSILFQIENDVRRVYLNHNANKSIKDKSLLIKSDLDKNHDFEIFKYLMRYDDCIIDWDDRANRQYSFDELKKLREDKFNEYAKNISIDNFDKWSQLINLFSQIKSRDMVAFMNFDKFLEILAKSSPELAIKLLSLNLEGRLVPLLKELWNSSERDNVNHIIESWINSGKNLYEISWMFVNNKPIEKEIIYTVIRKALELKDMNTLIGLMGVVVEHSENNIDADLMGEVFIPALTELTNAKDTRWISFIWFRKGLANVLSSLLPNEQDLLLRNVLYIESIDHHVESILLPLAKQTPDKVITLFKERVKHAKDSDKNYIAIPHDFYELHKALSVNPATVVDSIATWYKDGNFKYYGARLLSIIFPDFPTSLKNKLISLVQTKDKINIQIVLDILECYRENDNTFTTCKEIIKTLPREDKLAKNATNLLLHTGVVSGEFGLANEYIRRKNLIQEWLNDKDPKVRSFAEKFLHDLDKIIENEQQRATEDIELRKHLYGENNSNTD